jgi:hypothetical protein
VDGEVDLAIGAQERLGLVGHVRAAEHDHDAGLQRLQPTCDLEGDAAVPDVGAEADQIGVLQRFDGVRDAYALVERRQKAVALPIQRELLDIGLQKRDRIGQVVLTREGIVDLDEADLEGGVERQRRSGRRGRSGIVCHGYRLLAPIAAHSAWRQRPESTVR